LATESFIGFPFCSSMYCFSGAILLLPEWMRIKIEFYTLIEVRIYS
jgi:hypothetical protein